jgi:hypothetical protein
VFELEQSNFAAGARANGFYMTVDGSVYRYTTQVPEDDTATATLLRRRSLMTLNEVTAKHHTVEFMMSVDPEELAQMFGLVEQAKAGSLVATVCCADFGARELVAWTYDSSTDLYAPVVLEVEGDRCTKNTSPSAGDLSDWLWSAFYSDELVDSCEFPDRNTAVVSCEVCGDHQQCVTDEIGNNHCTLAGCLFEGCPTDAACGFQSAVDVTCECAGALLCASGGDWCRGSEAEGFHCAPP